MKILRIVLGVLNILACIQVVGMCVSFLSIGGWSAAGVFIWISPLIIAAPFALICGILTLKGKSWMWAVSGLVVAAAAWILPLLIALLSFH